MAMNTSSFTKSSSKKVAKKPAKKESPVEEPTTSESEPTSTVPTEEAKPQPEKAPRPYPKQQVWIDEKYQDVVAELVKRTGAANSDKAVEKLLEAYGNSLKHVGTQGDFVARDASGNCLLLEGI